MRSFSNFPKNERAKENDDFFFIQVKVQICAETDKAETAPLALARVSVVVFTVVTGSKLGPDLILQT